MSDLIIKGMEMPKSCDECPLYTCMHNHADCPLVEIPPHGRLIDADEAIRHLFIGEQCLYSWNEIEESIDATPTVIPAEEGS